MEICIQNYYCDIQIQNQSNDDNMFQSFLGLFTSSSNTLFTSKSSLERNKKVRKFVPEIIKDKSIHEIRSVLEFPIEAEDHQSVYKCRAFAAATMSAPKESALKATFNVTCKFFASISHMTSFV